MGILIIPRSQTLRFVRVFGNSEQSQTFRRNNCPGYLVGTYVKYTVPAGKYLSYNSLEEANKMALDDISKNGQDYANQWGSCPIYYYYGYTEPIGGGNL